MTARSALADLDMELKLSKADYKVRLVEAQAELNRLHRAARDRGIPLVIVFEGLDASGKGGAIRRLVPALDVRDVRVFRIGAPTEEELRYHYLRRFWSRLPRAGRVAIFDRSWYGRLLVERVEGFATEDAWRRAYEEIRDFEQQLADHGLVLVKFWLHITPDEQERRFHDREQKPHKSFKLTEEDLRNRARWDDYQVAASDMIRETDRPDRGWSLVSGNNKRYARVAVLETVARTLTDALD